MIACASEDVVIAKIVAQGCTRRDDLTDQASLYFSVTFRGTTWTFSVPRALEEDGYTEAQLQTIEVQLSRIGLELFPIDHHLLHG